MAKKLLPRRGAAAQHDLFTGDVGELTVDTTNYSVVVHDGITKGGHNHARDTAPLRGIKFLRKIPNVIQTTLGYHTDSNVGGGQWVYNPNRSWDAHDGGTVIAYPSLALYTGTVGTLAFVLQWNANTLGVSGVGCWERINFTRTISPEDFGAPAVNKTFSFDDTAALQKLFNFVTAIEDEGAYIVELNRLYTANFVTVSGRYYRGVRIRGRSGSEYKRTLLSTGFVPFQDNQICVIKFGGDEQAGDSESNFFQNVSFFGRDFNFSVGMVWMSRLSQGYALNCVFRRSKGPLLHMQKLEDWDFYNCNFGLSGNNDGRPALSFGEPPIHQGVLASVGNNAIRFFGGRLEFIDGPMIATVGVNAWASTVTFIGTKFETGSISTMSSDPYPNPEYGSHNANYYILKFTQGVSNRITVRLQAGCSFSGVSLDRCKGLIKADRGDEITCSNSVISGSIGQSFNLFELSSDAGGAAEIQTFVYTDNNHRSYGTGEVAYNQDFLFTNKNIRAIKFEYPFSGNVSTFRSTLTAGKNSWFVADISNNSVHIANVPNPNEATDPTESPSRSVTTVLDNTGYRVIAKLSTVGIDGLSKGFRFKYTRNILRIKAKISGTSINANGYKLFLRDDTGEVANVDITSTTLAWVSKTFTIAAGRGTNLRLMNITDGPGVSVFIEALEIIPILQDYEDHTFSLSVPALNPGTYSIVSFTAPYNLYNRLYSWTIVSSTDSLNNTEANMVVQNAPTQKIVFRNLNNSQVINAQTVVVKIRYHELATT